MTDISSSSLRSYFESFISIDMCESVKSDIIYISNFLSKILLVNSLPKCVYILSKELNVFNKNYRYVYKVICISEDNYISILPEVERQYLVPPSFSSQYDEDYEGRSVSLTCPTLHSFYSFGGLS